MLRLLRFTAGLLTFAAVLWFSFRVPLGAKTLFGHLKAIVESKETHELFEGTKSAAKPIIDKIEAKAGLKTENGPAKERTSKEGAAKEPSSKEGSAKRHGSATLPRGELRGKSSTSP